MNGDNTGNRPRRHYLILVIPYIWFFAVVGINRIHALILGIPLLEWWMMLGVLVCMASLAAVWCIDRRREAAMH